MQQIPFGPEDDGVLINYFPDSEIPFTPSTCGFTSQLDEPGIWHRGDYKIEKGKKTDEFGDPIFAISVSIQIKNKDMGTRICYCGPIGNQLHGKFLLDILRIYG